ncbi:hypothetical protein EIN_206280 [Entamoeba invadens IP1]|uniref:Uncharacterized protein n=1 Tax=Entamoeba invadens IP1 TaxID=370355 RepID=A0A0A1U9I0_ENTIV|nr:hypothetical protein EIN_206280 [Entamoeba invadens IP1]ELP91641.1 hypothetical protein EIN_206280 [Entamoeba invadens IP1]|eukprot:XP_004258412.1 hypothetical protein EIN_206280 [Entamoeba invadens IP1]
MTLEETSTWIDQMFDLVPLNNYVTEIEDSKYEAQYFEKERTELIVTPSEIEARRYSLEGPITISSYNKLLLDMKTDQIEQIQPINENEIDPTMFKNPREALVKRLHDKIEETRTNKVRPITSMHGKTYDLPQTKIHEKRTKKDKTENTDNSQHHKTSTQKGKFTKKGKQNTPEKFERPSMTSPELKDNLDFGTVSFVSGKSVPKYLNRKKRHD